MKQQLDTFYFKNMVMLFNVSFNNISVIAWQPVLLVAASFIGGGNRSNCRKPST